MFKQLAFCRHLLLLIEIGKHDVPINFYLWGEDKCRSIEWVIIRLVKTAAKIVCHANDGMRTSHLIFRCGITTGRYLVGIVKGVASKKLFRR